MTRTTSILLPLLLLVALTTAQSVHKGEKLKKQILSDGVFAEGTAFADVNGDGHDDLVAGPLIHLGPDFTEAKRFRPGDAVSHIGYAHRCFFSWVLDLDDDGRADILQVGHEKDFNLRIYLQPEQPSEAWPGHVVIDHFGNESPTLADVTGDGTPELVAMHQGQFGFFQINRKDPTQPWPFHAISEKRKPYPYFHGLGIGDLNGDGRPDIVEKDGWFEAPADPLNDPWPYHAFSFTKPGGAQMLIYDIDGDGDNDIVTSLAAHAWGLAWFENVSDENGHITFKKHELIPTDEQHGVGGVSFTQAHALELGDFNGDGHTDFVTGKRYWAHNGRDPDAKGPAVLYWYELKRGEKGVEFIPHLLDRNSGAGTQITVRDINGDGISDIGIASKKGVFIFQSQ